MITPIEIRQQAFNKKLRGYDPEEVKGFLQGLSQEWESLREENRSLKEELERTKANYHALKEVEDMLHKTLMQAERSSKDTLETARQKAELKIQEADSQASEIIRRAIKDREDLQTEIGDLYKQREEVLMQLRVYLKTQLERLDSFTPSDLLPTHSYSSLHTNGQAPELANKPRLEASTNNGSEKPANTNGQAANLLAQEVKSDANIIDDFSDDL
ncbi:MAG: DivIVA domain-containing protein [Bacteroidota bacterium]